MLYLNSGRRALVAMALLLVTVPALRAQEPSVASAPIRGDVDGDGRVTRADAEAVRAYLVRGTLPAGRSILPTGDANGDGRVTAADAALISRFAAGVDVSRFPVGRPVDSERRNPGGATLQSGDQFCTADVRVGTITCSEVLEGTTAQNVILGEPFVAFLTTTSFSDDNTGEDTATYTLRIRNDITQPLGTADGTTLAADGLRLFVSSGPAVRTAGAGPASVRVETPDGTATFTNQNGSATYTNKPYLQYNEVLQPADTSAARSMQFIYSANVTTFTYSYRVSARAQYEHGWVTIAPATVPILSAGQTATLTGTVYDQVNRVQADGITWSSSNEAVATVNASGVVTAGSASGTATITATSSVNNQRTGTRIITVDQFPTVVSTSPANNATGVLPGGNIQITFSEPVDIAAGAFTLECPDNSAQAFSVSGSGTAVITLDPTASLPAAETCEVTVDGNKVTDSDAFDGPNMMPANYSFTFETAIQAVDDSSLPTVVGNVPMNTAHLSPTAFSVKDNDKIKAGTTITFAGSGSNAGQTQQGGTVVMKTSGDSLGQFFYNPPAGYEGPDSFVYVISYGGAVDTATVSLNVAGMIWFVRADAAGECTTHCGRRTSPFKSLATFNAANAAVGSSNPADNEAVFLFEGTYANPITLRNGQKLIGQDAMATLSTLTGYTFPEMDSVPVMNSGNAAKVILQGNDGINLAQNNAVHGLTVSSVGGEAIGGNGFGTLTVADVSIDATGQALSLTSGTLSGGFDHVISLGGTNNVLLSSVSTSGTAALGVAADSVRGATGDGFVITNGTGSFTYAGKVRNNATRAVTVTGKSGGSVTFSGEINQGTAGTGISVGSNTGGTVTFSGAAKNISSAAAGGVSLTSNTGATVAFTNGGLAVTSTTGVPFTATGGGTVEVSGASNTISVTGAAANAVNLNGITLAAGGMSFASISSTGSTTSSAFTATSVGGGAFTAASISVAGTTGGTSRGIALTTNSAPFTFTTASVNGTGAEGIYLNGNTAAVNISGGTVGNTASPAGDALAITGGNAVVTVAATLTKSSAGRIANIASRTGAAVTLSGNLSCTGSCTGIFGNANAGTLDFTAGTKTLTTGASAAVTLTNNTGTINFTNGGLVITTTSGAGFSASGGGTVNVEGTNNTVASTTGTAVSISGTTIGGNGVRFRSVSANGAPNGIFLNNTGNSGGQFRVDGTGTVGSGGSILNTTGADGATSGNGVYLNTVRNVVLAGMIINDHPNFGIFGQTVNGFTLDNSRLAGTHGTNIGLDESVISFTGLDGQAVFSNDSISGGIEDNVRILNHGVVSAATDSILFNNVRMGHVNSTSGNTALLVRVADGSSNRVRIRNSVFHGSRGGSTFHLNVVNTATARLALDANTFNNTQTQISGAGGVLITASGTAASVPTLTYNITGNTFRGSRTVALNINKDVGQAVINGNISGNTIGDAAVTNSGSSEASGIQLRHQGGGTHRATVTKNQIFQYNNYGIILEEGDAVAGGGHGRMDVTLTGNTVSNPGTLAFSWNGLHANVGTVTDDAHILCLAASGNSMDNSGTATQDIRLRQRMKSTIILPGYGGSASDNTAVNNFVKANNGNGAGLTVVASNSVGVGSPNGPGNGFINGSCNAPTF